MPETLTDHQRAMIARNDPAEDTAAAIEAAARDALDGLYRTQAALRRHADRNGWRATGALIDRSHETARKWGHGSLAHDLAEIIEHMRRTRDPIDTYAGQLEDAASDRRR